MQPAQRCASITVQLPGVLWMFETASPAMDTFV
jgi:hypothetical protein